LDGRDLGAMPPAHRLVEGCGKEAEAEPRRGFTIMMGFSWLRHPFQEQQETKMSIIGWIVLGLVAGFIASKIVNKQGEGIVLDIVLGVVGAVVGGYLFSMFGAQGVDGLNIYSMFVAVVGAIVVLVIYHTITGRRTV